MSGWDDIEGMQQSLQAPKGSDQDKLCLKVFGTESGQKLLKLLRDQTIEQPSWSPGSDASLGYFMEGRCSLVKEIEARINRARNL